MAHLPQGLTRLQIGTCPLLKWEPTLLPDGLVSLKLSDQTDVDSLSSIPGSVETLTLNRVTPLPELADLPEGLIRLDLDNLRQITDLRGLPTDLVTLWVGGCPAIKTLPLRSQLQELFLAPQASYQVYMPDEQTLIEGRTVSSGAEYLALRAEVERHVLSRKKRPPTERDLAG